jgi:hypothetical protein
MATTAGHRLTLRLTLDPMGKFSNAFFSETTNMIKAKLYMNVYCLGSVSSLVSEKKIRLERKTRHFVEDHPRNIPAKFGSNWPSGFGEEV